MFIVHDPKSFPGRQGPTWTGPYCPLVLPPSPLLLSHCILATLAFLLIFKHVFPYQNLYDNYSVCLNNILVCHGMACCNPRHCSNVTSSKRPFLIALAKTDFLFYSVLHWGPLTLVCKSWLCTSLPNSIFSDSTLVAWKWPLWKHLHRRNQQTLQKAVRPLSVFALLKAGG